MKDFINNMPSGICVADDFNQARRQCGGERSNLLQNTMRFHNNKVFVTLWMCSGDGCASDKVKVTLYSAV